jgi:protein kinase C substrate 80K-H
MTYTELLGCFISIGKQPSTISKKVLGKLNEVLPSSWKDRIFSNGQGQKTDGDDGDSGGDHLAYTPPCYHNAVLTSFYDLELDRVRQLRDGVDAEIKSLETKVRDINDKLNFDYGKQREWLKLQETCVEKDDGE